MDYRQMSAAGLFLLCTGGVAAATLASCGGETATPVAPAPAPVEEATEPDGPLATILMVQAQFIAKRPGPARLTLWRTDGKNWWDHAIEDKDSSVFHKAIPFRGGVLTAGAGQVKTDPPAPAKLSHWTKDGDTWKETVLWSQVWGGKFQRLRDMELGDFDGDGADEIAIATHDMGVIAVADEANGAWTVQEMDERPDTFVHEIEAGDVDGDGIVEFYATPSARNKASGESQPGGVVRYDFKGGKYVRSDVVMWENTHAKEILVADTDGDGTPELYAVAEAVVVKDGSEKKRQKPVTIWRFDKEGADWKGTEVATLDDDQCRFLMPGDLNGDGKTDLLAAAYKSGLWMLEGKGDGTFEPVLIDKNSGGFEHASHVADLDGDGKLEIYVAADTQREFRAYTWNGDSFDRKKIAPIPKSRITWNLSDGKF